MKLLGGYTYNEVLLMTLRERRKENFAIDAPTRPVLRAWETGRYRLEGRTVVDTQAARWGWREVCTPQHVEHAVLIRDALNAADAEEPA